MSPPSIARLAHKYGVNSLVDLPPAFLAPALYAAPLKTPVHRSKFSTTSHLSLKDKSKGRGISAIHRTGTRHPLSVAKYPLPKPEPIERQEKRPENPNHGLWGFFPETKNALATPEEEYSHGMKHPSHSVIRLCMYHEANNTVTGRAWTIQELRQKSWDELHSLWWVCVRERNRLATSNYERNRLKAGYGDFEAENREKTVSSDPPLPPLVSSIYFHDDSHFTRRYELLLGRLNPIVMILSGLL